MAFYSDIHVIGVTPIANTDAGIIPPGNVNTGSTTTIPTPPLMPGMIVRAVDPTYGEGEFILLKGVASTAVGSIVTYNTSSFTTALAPAGTNKPQPIAVAMSANTSSSNWGWYQISGIAVAAKTAATTLSADVAIGVATAGLVSASSTGAEVQGALVAVAAGTSATTVQIVINRPHMQGRIT
jgi:hypothetical protein